jgi:hypothetical protein
MDAHLVHFAYLLHDLCTFRNPRAASEQLNSFLAACPSESAAVLEAAHWLDGGKPAIRVGPETENVEDLDDAKPIEMDSATPGLEGFD